MVGEEFGKGVDRGAVDGVSAGERSMGGGVALAAEEDQFMILEDDDWRILSFVFFSSVYIGVGYPWDGQRRSVIVYIINL